VRVDSLDHLVLTVRDLDATCDWYTRVLGMAVETFEGGRVALRFGVQKINLHEAGHEFEPKAARPAPGSADLCFLTAVPLAEVIAHLAAARVTVEEGPVARIGATDPLPLPVLPRPGRQPHRDRQSWWGLNERPAKVRVPKECSSRAINPR